MPKGVSGEVPVDDQDRFSLKGLPAARRAKRTVKITPANQAGIGDTRWQRT